MDWYTLFFGDGSVTMAISPLITALVIQAAFKGLSALTKPKQERVSGFRADRGFEPQRPGFLSTAFDIGGDAAGAFGQFKAGQTAADLAFSRQQGAQGLSALLRLKPELAGLQGGAPERLAELDRLKGVAGVSVGGNVPQQVIEQFAGRGATAESIRQDQGVLGGIEDIRRQISTERNLDIATKGASLESVKLRDAEIKRINTARIAEITQSIKESEDALNRKLPKGVKVFVSSRVERIKGKQRAITTELRVNADETVIARLNQDIVKLQGEIDAKVLTVKPKPTPPKVIKTTESVINEFKDLSFDDVNNPEFLKAIKDEIPNFDEKLFLDAFRRATPIDTGGATPVSSLLPQQQQQSSPFGAPIQGQQPFGGAGASSTRINLQRAIEELNKRR